MYIKKSADMEREGKKILDDVNQCIAAAVANYPGLRRFLQGRNFKQWTGNSSKVLMKV
jgi:hypothetical protein